MRLNLLSTCLLSCLFIHFAVGQINVSPANISIVAEKWKDMELIAPIEFRINNPTSVAQNIQITMSLNTPAALASLIEVRENNRTINIRENSSLKAAVYVYVDKTALITSTLILPFTITILGSTTASVVIPGQLTIIRGYDIVYTLNDYMYNNVLILNSVSKVESVNNILTVYGTIDGRIAKRKVELASGEVLAISSWSTVGMHGHFSPAPFSFTTIPFKVRRKVTTSSGQELQRTASSGLTNIGFNLELMDYQMDRYFSDGKKSTHRFSLGFWAAPAVEELDSTVTSGFRKGSSKSKQLFISTGLTISYTYNDISFVFVPAGWDFGTSTIGHKWAYDEKRWWGFGIAISPKIFATVLNK